MNEIRVETIEMELPKITFNHKEILEDLEVNLKKYDNLTFTEKQTPELRKTIAELRKGIKAVEDYRKSTKKELSEPIKTFESKCKEITSHFSDRVNKLNEQLTLYEEQRKEKKRIKIQEIIANTLNETVLEQKYADKLVVEDEFLNKSMSIKEITETIQFVANNLKMTQEKEYADKEMIETFIKLKNSEHDMNIPIEPYISRLEFESHTDVKNAIENDVKRELNRLSREKAEQQAKEELKQKAEHQAKEELKRKEETKQVEEKPFEPIIEDLPFGDVEIEQPLINTEYIISTTLEQHNEIVNFLNDKGIKFHTREELPF